MPKYYRAQNKRLIPRAHNGQFRRGQLSDVGMAECEVCHRLFAPDYSDLEESPNPRVIKERQRFCPAHPAADRK